MIMIIYNVAANYFPVSLTCVASKILKHVLTSQLMTFAETHNLFHLNQHISEKLMDVKSNLSS